LFGSNVIFAENNNERFSYDNRTKDTRSSLTFCTRPEEFHSGDQQTCLFFLWVYDDKSLVLFVWWTEWLFYRTERICSWLLFHYGWTVILQGLACSAGGMQELTKAGRISGRIDFLINNKWINCGTESLGQINGIQFPA